MFIQYRITACCYYRLITYICVCVCVCINQNYYFCATTELHRAKARTSYSNLVVRPLLLEIIKTRSRPEQQWHIKWNTQHNHFAKWRNLICNCNLVPDFQINKLSYCHSALTPLKKNLSYFCIFGVSTDRGKKWEKIALTNVKLADAQERTKSRCWKKFFQRYKEVCRSRWWSQSMELDCFKEDLKEYDNFAHYLSYINTEEL